MKFLQKLTQNLLLHALGLGIIYLILGEISVPSILGYLIGFSLITSYREAKNARN